MYAERIVKRLRWIMGIAVLLAYGTGFLTGLLVASDADRGSETERSTKASASEQDQPQSATATGSSRSSR